MFKRQYGRHLPESPAERKHLSLHRQAGGAWLWILIGLALLGGLAGYGYYHPEALPAWVRALTPIIPGLPEPHASKPLYRWRDEQGRVQITDIPPEGRPYETLVYSRDVNVVPSRGGEDR